jgi:hypothetical protein
MGLVEMGRGHDERHWQRHWPCATVYHCVCNGAIPYAVAVWREHPECGQQPFPSAREMTLMRLPTQYCINLVDRHRFQKTLCKQTYGFKSICLRLIAL